MDNAGTVAARQSSRVARAGAHSAGDSVRLGRTDRQLLEDARKFARLSDLPRTPGRVSTVSEILPDGEVRYTSRALPKEVPQRIELGRKWPNDCLDLLQKAEQTNLREGWDSFIDYRRIAQDLHALPTTVGRDLPKSVIAVDDVLSQGIFPATGGGLHRIRILAPATGTRESLEASSAICKLSSDDVVVLNLLPTTKAHVASWSGYSAIDKDAYIEWGQRFDNLILWLGHHRPPVLGRQGIAPDLVALWSRVFGPCRHSAVAVSSRPTFWSFITHPHYPTISLPHGWQKRLSGQRLALGFILLRLNIQTVATQFLPSLLPASVTAADRLLDCPARLGRVARSVRQRSINSVDQFGGQVGCFRVAGGVHDHRENKGKTFFPIISLAPSPGSATNGRAACAATHLQRVTAQAKH